MFIVNYPVIVAGVVSDCFVNAGAAAFYLDLDLKQMTR